MEWLKELKEKFEGEVSFDEPLAVHTYYRIGGPASALVQPRNLDELKTLARLIQAFHPQLFILGKGSNLLVSDKGFPGLVVKTSKLEGKINFGEGRLSVGAGVAITQLLREASIQGWSGLEFLAGVPGSVGGAVFMNAGTHLGETSNAVLEVEVFDLGGKGPQESKFVLLDLKYSYRKNHFLGPGEMILSVKFKIQKKDPSEVKAALDEMLKRRKQTQPIDYPSCGSVFKNPSPDQSAWKVIDQLGLRGTKSGQAQFSDKHPNFIINLGGARSKDVRALIELAQSRALAELNIELQTEVIYLE